MFEHERPTDEYDHDYENVSEDEVPDRDRSLRITVWIVSAVVAILMVALPVLRVIESRDGDDVETAAGDARELVASRFADAILVRRSSDDASRWALPSLQGKIDAIVAELGHRPAADLIDATGNVARVQCDPGIDREAECFHAWLRRPMAFEFIRILIVVGIVNGDAVVIQIERVNVV